MNKFVKYIAITGGPQAGKTTFLAHIKKELENKGFNVFVLSETATDLINAGFKPNICGYKFQNILFLLQNTKEEACISYVKSELVDEKREDKKYVVFFDRSCMDIKAYVPESEWEHILKKHKLSESQILIRYDLIIHLETAIALNKKEIDNKTNPARYETNKSDIINIDKRLIDVYGIHKNTIMVNAHDDIFEKYNRFVATIYQELNLN